MEVFWSSFRHTEIFAEASVTPEKTAITRVLSVAMLVICVTTIRQCNDLLNTDNEDEAILAELNGIEVIRHGESQINNKVESLLDK